MTDITLVTEAYNMTEGQSWESMVASINVLKQLQAKYPKTEIILLDPSGDARVQKLAIDSKTVKHVSLPLQTKYDVSKNIAAEIAQGRYIVYLDGDCHPDNDNWLANLLQPLKLKNAHVTTGTTIYNDLSLQGIACSIMDFGFLWDQPDGPVGCYASNNVAFERELRCQIPVVEGSMRCQCYRHAQDLKRAQKIVRHVSNALVWHDMPHLETERIRRGFDLVAACWLDTSLPACQWLHPSFTLDRRCQYFLTDIKKWDKTRLQHLPEKLRVKNSSDILSEMIRLRDSLDIKGITQALQDGDNNGENLKAYTAHFKK